MYTFKLQTVLDHRRFLEDSLKRELAEIRQQTIEAQQQLESLESKEMQTVSVLKQEQAEGLSSDKVVAYHTYLRDLADRICQKQKMVMEIKEQEAAKQGELLDALKRRQILEKLKDQGLDRFNRTMLKKEMNFIDEIAVNQFVRKTRSRHEEGE